MSFCQDLHVGGDKDSVADGDAALVEERATEVDEHTLAHLGHLAKGGVEGREHPHRLIQLLSPNLLQQRANLIGGVVRCIELGHKGAGLLKLLPQKRVVGIFVADVVATTHTLNDVTHLASRYRL